MTSRPEPPTPRPDGAAPGGRGGEEDLHDWPTGRLLSSAARLVEHEWNQHLATWDLNHASLGVLHVLLAGQRTQRELAGAVQVEDQTMSRILERLERSGHVERRRDAADGRRRTVTITSAGRRTCLQASDSRVAEGFFAEVEDVDALRGALIAVIRARSEERWATPPT